MPTWPVMITVLFVSANPHGQADLLFLHAGVIASERALRDAPLGAKMRFVMCPSARRADLHKALVAERPTIVCFSGHASEEGIALEEEDGSITVMSVEALAGLLRAHADHVKLVVLAACNTYVASLAIVEHIDCAIAMAGKPEEKHAALFTPLFFQALAYYRSVASAFESAKHASETSGDPRLTFRPGITASALSISSWLAKDTDKIAMNAEVNMKMWWEEVPFPWSRKEAQRLLNRVVQVYRSVRVTQRLVAKTSIDGAEWDQGGSLRTVWQSLLDVAADQGKVNELLTTILDDPAVSGAHKDLRTITGLDKEEHAPGSANGPPSVRGYKVALVDLDRADAWKVAELLQRALGLDSKTSRERARAGAVAHNNLTREEAMSVWNDLSDLGALASVEAPHGEAPARRIVRAKMGFPMVYIPDGATCRAFWMMAYPVTRGLYAHVMGQGGMLRDLERPMEGVSWDQAVFFCERLTREEGLIGAPYRLPTEAEWEHAARAHDGTRYAGSNHWPDVAWAESAYAHPVRAKKPNGFGLYDMSGNVWEWTQDTPKAAPDGLDLGLFRVARGGSYSSRPADIEVRSRRVVDRADAAEVGFRIARSVD